MAPLNVIRFLNVSYDAEESYLEVARQMVADHFDYLRACTFIAPIDK